MERSIPRTVHVVVPATRRPLCGYDEEVAPAAEGATSVACPECSALLRSGVVARRRLGPQGWLRAPKE